VLAAILFDNLQIFMIKIFYLLLFVPTFILGQKTKEILIHSKELKADRNIWINTPEYYEFRKDSLHLVFLLDGNNKSLFDYTVASKRFLERNSVDLSDYKVPQSIVVGIEQAKNRWDDFGDSVNSQKFLSFLENEIIPFVKSNYRTLNYKILIGHSLGGYFAINTLLNKPSLFNATIAASPAFPKKIITRTLTKFDTLFNSKLRFDKALYFSTTYIKGDGTEENFREFSEALEKYLKNKSETNFRYKFNSSNTLGHGKSPFFSIPEGLHFIYSPSLWQLQVDSLFSKSISANQAVKNYEQRIRLCKLPQKSAI
jgi:predicted alpha/beta superfamily hydrolase